MNISSNLNHLFKAEKVHIGDPVIAKFRGKYFVGHVLLPEETAKDNKQTLDIQWYKPWRASRGYRNETVFIPTFTKNNKPICDYIHQDNMFPLRKFVKTKDMYGDCLLYTSDAADE